MKIGIYGGTFDPPHIGHISAARQAGKAIDADKVLLIPAGIPPHKELHDSSASAEDRLQMVKLASRYIENAEVSDIELNRGGRSFTVDTLTELKKTYPEDELFLFIGTDMLMMFERWHRFEDIMKLCTLAVFSREDGGNAVITAEARRLMELYDCKIVIINNDEVEISSTEVRNTLAARSGNAYLTDEVYAYILRNGLYGAKANLDWLRTKAYGLLKERRIPHVAGCEYEAVRLAEKWGADAEMAREAAILHDCTKYADYDAQLILCDKYGIMLDDDDRKSGNILHAYTGAGLAREEFGVCDEVYNAIFYHTTGKADMTLLEKIIYLADYIEPTRNFAGLDEVRFLAYSDIDDALRLAFAMSLKNLGERGIVPHPKTAEAAAWLENN